MDNNAKMSIMATLAKYAIDKGYEVHMVDDDKIAAMGDVKGNNQSFADKGFSIHLCPFIVGGGDDEDEEGDDSVIV